MQSATTTASTSPGAWTVLSLIAWAGEHLSSCGFDEARLHAELMLAHVLHLRRLDLYLQFDRPLSPAELALFKALFKRRLMREPLQYILGETDFMGLKIAVDRNVLIPRPETELLVEQTLDAIRDKNGAAVRILEIGTGSGNIAVALGHFAPHAVITSFDISAEALSVAAANVERNTVRNVTLLQADVFADVVKGETFDIVVSNPPYVSAGEFALLQPEVRDYEPRHATTDDADGYRVIRRVLDLAWDRLTPGGHVLIEVAAGQSREVETLAARRGFNVLEAVRDFSHIPRVVRARTPLTPRKGGTS